MKPTKTIAASLVKKMWTATMLLAAIFCFTVAANSQDSAALQLQSGAQLQWNTQIQSGAGSESPRETTGPAIAQYAMEYDGDRSLDLATIVEQALAGYTRYIVHLQLASGGEQSLAVAAPPGGLRVEMRDMTGDNVANDLILIPRLIAWPPTVLVNNGHNHFEVAISSGFPGSLGSTNGRASGPQDDRAPVPVIFSGSKAGGLPKVRALFTTQLAKRLHSLASAKLSTRLDYGASSGRAPPQYRSNA
jgi:hypothetical protein